ncbi:MAG: ATP-binding domain-containing protein [Acetatifactor sp.]
MDKLPGITRQEEEEKLRRTIAVAEEKVEANRRSVRELAEELHTMQEEFDESDKEAQTLWRNTDARFKFVNQDLRRAEQARKKPYFGRIDFRDKKLKKEEVYYIGRSVIADNPAEPEVIDWRAPIASVYYDATLGEVSYFVRGEGKYEITLSRKRTYEIEEDRLKDFYDSDVVANDELLTKYLARNKRAVLGEIIATIQQEQNEVIRKKPQHNLIIQGAAGSGKTTVAMHRISYILYNYELEFPPEDFYIIGSNQVLLNYITGVLPELNVYGVSQMTMEQLFVRLLYEDWDKSYTVKPVQRGVTPPVKGTWQWFRELEDFCLRYEERVIPQGDVVIEKNGVVLLTARAVRKVLDKSIQLSRADKITRLTEHLLAKLENEISGKYYSYTQAEKKRLWNYYETYFGKREWKGSIFELYDLFLREQNEKGFRVPLPGTEFDVYDLAALAYLYKRIKEDEIIREAGHVVIDEAQDFGMMVYGALKYCLSKCTYTIMGDVSQNIFMDYGLNDWSELRKLMLPGEFDYFGLLRKSYRNTVEISHFATDILYHGSFQIYPVEPIIRHGKEVQVKACPDFEGLLDETAAVVQAWEKAGMETIAVVCADREETAAVHKGLEGRVELLAAGDELTQFEEGVMVLPLEYTKGLEFDAVLLFDVSEEKYPMTDGYVKRLYVAATRALHELVVLYQGKLTGLIADPVPEENRKRAVVQVSAPKKAPLPPEPEKTNEEIYRQRALEGEKERKMRDMYGPRRIEVGKGNPAPDGVSQSADLRGATGSGPMTENGRSAGIGQSTAPGPSAGIERRAGTGQTGEAGGGSDTAPRGEFGTMPDTSLLRPEGHTKTDCSIRFFMKGKGCLDFISGYGTMRITPMSDTMVRVCFARGQCNTFPPAAFEKENVNYKIREGRDFVELSTAKLVVRGDKKTGAVSFLTSEGKVLLTERGKEPRLVGVNRTWQFFDWGKGEELFARGPETPKKVGNSALYISFDKNSRMLPALASSKGYQLTFPPGEKLLCCNVPVYGTYVSAEEKHVIDYYFTVV